ncbi:MAG: metallophosphoesterase family protein [Rectinemataceae bacterium]
MRPPRHFILACLLLPFAILAQPSGGPGLGIPAADSPRARGSTTGAAPPRGSRASPELPAIAPLGELHLGTLLEFPGTTSVGLATAFDKTCEYYYEYGETPGRLDSRTDRRVASAGSVSRDRIAGLAPGRVYSYRLAWRESTASSFSFGPPGRCATMKGPSRPFIFAIEADPHLDGNSSAAVYERSLDLMGSDAPDFVIDLGDTAMTEKLAKDPATSVARFRLIRSYWDTIGGSAPFFMVAGNHDGEQGWLAGSGKPDSKETTVLRRTWLVDAADAPGKDFSVQAPTVYSFEWGDALFIMLDPYIAESSKPAEGWDWTLGKDQYDWLAAVLARSKAPFRFVFIHHLVGGRGRDARGGADVAGYYEWGGRSMNGSDDFAAMRPGWPLPVSGLLASQGVTAVFHGHDHFYARDEREGIVYQEVPQPSLARGQAPRPEQLEEYGYSTGDFLPSPGYLRVSVSADRSRVEYVRSSDGSVGASWDMVPRTR